MLTAVFCYLPLATVVAPAVTVLIPVQFVGQIAALDRLRRLRPDILLPFRMRLYPLPSLLALCAWLRVLAMSDTAVLVAALGVLVSGLIVFVLWQLASRRTASW